MKEKICARSLAVLSILFLLITSLTAASVDNPNDTFLQCFLNRTNSPQLVYTSSNPSYTNILQSSIRNSHLFYSTTTKKPDLIITPTDAAQVQSAVICCRTHGLRIRVRSGGHDYEGLSYISSSSDDPFILIDLASLRSITIDAAHRSATVQAGATIGELYYAINQKDPTFGFPAGICPTLGVGGHFSGGGIGTISRKYGTSADNIVDAELIDPNGNLLNRQSMGEDAFWAIRGGGAASFGIVISFKINLVSVPLIVTAFNVIRTLRTNATGVLTRWQTVAPTFDLNLYIRVVAQAVNSGSEGRTIQVLFNSVFLGRKTDLLPLMGKSFPELGLKPEDCSEMSWLQSLLFFANYQGQQAEVLLDRKPTTSSFKDKSDFVMTPIAESGWQEIWNFLMGATDEPVGMILEPFGGRMSEISEAAIPFPHRIGNLYEIQYYMNWMERDDAVAQKHIDWMRKLYDFMTPYVSNNPRAAYLNYKDLDLGRNGVNASYSVSAVWGTKYFKSNFKRLAHVKGKIDPTNFFRDEQSIPPLLSSEMIWKIVDDDIKKFM